ncbi:MAG: hypothetical protein ACC635_06525 [Acidiferrobacterales bacterium]
MSKEEYDILLWVLGNSVNEFNQAAMLIVITMSTISLVSYLANKAWSYIQFKSDVEFWTNVLPV